MDMPSFSLKFFEGPLDLLLHLIAKNKLNIYDINISELLDQYMLYINAVNETTADISSEFLEMASRLVYIKTVSLLPNSDEADALKSELSGELLEYRVCRMIAERLSSLDELPELPSEKDENDDNREEENIEQTVIQVNDNTEEQDKSPAVSGTENDNTTEPMSDGVTVSCNDNDSGASEVES